MPKPRSGGPKPLFGVNSDKQISVRLTPDKFKQLEQKVANSKAPTISAFVRQIVLENLEKKNGT
jgi:hypothetical protein